MRSCVRVFVLHLFFWGGYCESEDWFWRQWRYLGSLGETWRDGGREGGREGRRYVRRVRGKDGRKGVREEGKKERKE